VVGRAASSWACVLGELAIGRRRIGKHAAGRSAVGLGGPLPARPHQERLGAAKVVQCSTKGKLEKKATR